MSDPISGLVGNLSQSVELFDPDRLLSLTEHDWQLPESLTKDIKQFADAVQGIELRDRFAKAELAELLEELAHLCTILVGETQRFLKLIREKKMTPGAEGDWRAIFSSNMSGMSYLLNRIRAASPHVQAGGQEQTDTKTIWSHGDRCYSFLGSRPGKVPRAWDDVLKAFVDGNIALDTSDLEEHASNPSSVIANLAKRFPGAVEKPMHKGAGYFIRVRTYPGPN